MEVLQSLELPKFKALYDLQSTSAVPNYDLATLCVYRRSYHESSQSAKSFIAYNIESIPSKTH